MDQRRKWLGRQIKYARTVQHDSQAAFASSIGLSEASVANAERGSDRVGDKVFARIEAALGWKPGASRSYLATGDRSLILVDSEDVDESLGQHVPIRRHPDYIAWKTDYKALLQKGYSSEEAIAALSDEEDEIQDRHDVSRTDRDAG